MFQLIGSLLAFFAIVGAVANAPFAGAVFALLTFIWVVVAKPRHRSPVIKDEAPWGSGYEARLSR